MKTLFFVIVVFGLVGMWLYYEAANYDPEAVAKEVLDKINEYRGEKGQAELVWDDELARLAIAHSQVMQETGCFEHSKHPYCENILKGGRFPDGESVASEWKASTAHYLVMTSEITTRGAVGIVEGFWGAYATFMAR